MPGLPDRKDLTAKAGQIHATTFKATPREAEILDLLCRGYEDKEITAALGMSLGTLRTHMDRLFRKARQHHRAGLVAAYLNDRSRPAVARKSR